MTINYETLGKTIKHFRLKKGYSQERLAEICDLSPSYLSYIETGKKRITLSLLIKIANELDFTFKICPNNKIFNRLGRVETDIVNLLTDCNLKEKIFIYNLISLIVKEYKNINSD